MSDVGSGGSGGWFAVFYMQTGQVSSRFATQDIPGLKFVQAASADAAAAQVLAADRNATIYGTPLGPFATRADAQAAATKTQQQIAAGTQAGSLPSIPNPLAGIDEIGAVLQAFFTAIADWHLWASIGWIALGLVMLLAGFRLWLGKPALPKMPSVIPIPV